MTEVLCFAGRDLALSAVLWQLCGVRGVSLPRGLRESAGIIHCAQILRGTGGKAGLQGGLGQEMVRVQWSREEDGNPQWSVTVSLLHLCYCVVVSLVVVLVLFVFSSSVKRKH